MVLRVCTESDNMLEKVVSALEKSILDRSNPCRFGMNFIALVHMTT